MQELEAAIDEYFERRQEVSVPPTVAGLALWLGFEDRQSIYDYKERPAFSCTIKKAITRIEEYAEMQLLTGEGQIAGFDLRRLRRRDIPYLRRRIGIVFQDYQLLTDRNVFMNLYYVMKATGWKHEHEIRERIDKVLGLVELGAKSYKMPFELSGGEQQRLVIARALLNDPQVLLADEPTGNLDPVTADGIMKLFRRIAEEGCAVVMSTHNTALIENYPARAILFAQGRIREVDLTAELA